jgi:Mg2+ and Co2+ transporter CorA
MDAKPHLRDLYENTVQAIEALKSYRGHTASMIELNLSEANRDMAHLF